MLEKQPGKAEHYTALEEKDSKRIRFVAVLRAAIRFEVSRDAGVCNCVGCCLILFPLHSSPPSL